MVKVGFATSFPYIRSPARMVRCLEVAPPFILSWTSKTSIHEHHEGQKNRNECNLLVDTDNCTAVPTEDLMDSYQYWVVVEGSERKLSEVEGSHSVWVAALTFSQGTYYEGVDFFRSRKGEQFVANSRKCSRGLSPSTASDITSI